MGQSVLIKAVTAGEIDAWLPRLAWMFQSFEDRSGGSQRVEDHIANIKARRTQCWAVILDDTPVACALTRLEKSRIGEVVITHCAGKDHKQWAETLLKTIQAWGREVQSPKLTIICRPGWEKTLKEFGMVKTHVVLEFDHG